MNRFNRYILFLFVQLFAAFTLSAQTAVRLWGDSHKQHRYKTELFVYLADSIRNTNVAVIICPGGSYCYLGLNVEGDRVARWLQSEGITAFVLRYRVNMFCIRHPAMIQDLQKSLAYVRLHAVEFHYSIDKVGVMGFSAGGHLAGLANTYAGTDFYEKTLAEKKISLRPSFVAMIYPVISMQDSIVHWRSRLNLIGHHPNRILLHDMSLELNVYSDMAPVFLMNCKDDPIVKDANSAVYDRALTCYGVSHVYFHYKYGGHGFGLYPKKKGTDAKNWNKEFIFWLRSIGMITNNKLLDANGKYGYRI